MFMDTYFASPEKTGARQIAVEIEAVSNNPLVSGLLRSVSGLLAILDENDDFIFCVWNSQQIPPEIAKRIFQRNFSTKAQAGRGTGTYSMKLFGEDILGGEVSFTSSQEDGTVFRFTHRLNR